MYDSYRDRVAFYAVYIQEAHPSDIWQMTSNLRDGVIFRDPRSDAERTGVAESCVRKLGIKFPALVDGIENTVEREYTGWPDRMYLIARDGRVAYKSAPGPYGFKPQQVEKTLQRLVTPSAK